MKTFLIISLLVFVTELKGQDVRNLTWGMSKASVKKIEGLQPSKTGVTDGIDYIAYDKKVGDLKCLIAFYFVADKLYFVKYIFYESHSEFNLYRDDFINIAVILDKKYGEVDIERQWNNDLYKDNPDDWGKAIAAGHLIMYTLRDLQKTKISHDLSGDNFEINHIVEFRSKELSELADKKIKEKKASDF